MRTVDKIARCQNQDSNRRWVVDFNSRTEGLHYLSVGLCCECGECRSTTGLSRKQLKQGAESGSVSDEGGFSRSSCDTCGSCLGGQRYAGHAYITLDDGRDVLTHLDVCTDCLQYIANGELPEA